MDNGADDFYRSRATPVLFYGSTMPFSSTATLVVACTAVVLSSAATIYESSTRQAPVEVAVSSTVAIASAQSTSITPTVTTPSTR